MHLAHDIETDVDVISVGLPMKTFPAVGTKSALFLETGFLIGSMVEF
jgi:hypothetical protein